jgi:hypothetical protein
MSGTEMPDVLTPFESNVSARRLRPNVAFMSTFDVICRLAVSRKSRFVSFRKSFTKLNAPEYDGSE